MYNIAKKTAPSYFADYLPVCHSYGTRNSKMSFSIPNVKTQGSNSFKFCGIKLWNDLPLNIKCAETKCNFKRQCKTFLMNKMENIENSDFIM